MKKIITILLAFLMLSFGSTLKAAAASNVPEVKVAVQGTVDTGSSITILLSIDNISNFYAGQADLHYDNQVLSIKGISKGDLISQSGINCWEASNKFDNSKGTLQYAFTCLGQISGFKGSGVFIKINAEVLKKADFHLKVVPASGTLNDDTNLKLELCTQNSGKIDDIPYNFTGYSFTTDSGTSTVPDVTVAPQAPSASAPGGSDSGNPSPSAGTASGGTGSENSASGTNTTVGSSSNGNSASAGNVSANGSNTTDKGTSNASVDSNSLKQSNSKTGTAKSSGSKTYNSAAASGQIDKNGSAGAKVESNKQKSSKVNYRLIGGLSAAGVIAAAAIVFAVKRFRKK